MHCIVYYREITEYVPMPVKNEEMIQIKEILKRYPRGLSITEISSALHLHRNTAAKYLDILKLKGDVDRKQIGTAKNYFLVQRVPVSSLIRYWPAPVIITDTRLHAVMVTEGVLTLLGCSLDVIYGEVIEEIPISLFNNPEITRICHDAIQGISGSIPVRTVIRKRELVLRIVGIPVVFDTGRDGAALVLYDETSEYHARMEQERYKQQYEALTTGQTEFILHIRPDMTVAYLNTPFSIRAGRSEEQIRGMAFRSFFPVTAHEMITSLLQGITFDSPSGEATLPMIRTDGNLGREQWGIRGIFDDLGRVVAYHAVGRDITELITCREQLDQYHRNLEELIEERTRSMQEANRMLMATIREKEDLERDLLFIQYAFDHASDSILLFNEEGRIIRANQTAALLLGYSQKELPGLHVYEINPSISKKQWGEMWAAGYPGKKERTESIHRRRNGEIFSVDVARTFVRFLDRMYFCSIARPIEADSGEQIH